MNRAWWKESVVYQIYPRSFNDSNDDGVGDIPGIIEKLGYLKKLGIDVIWLSPVYDSPNDDNGYDIRDYQSIMDEFGTMEDMERLLDEVHRHGMKLIMDLVVNHTSDEHKWFVEAKQSEENPYRDYYIWRPGKDGREPTNWEAAFSGSAWEYNEATDDYYLHLFSKKQPDLNWENPKLRTEVYDMMKWWLDRGIDGFRMDVINFISKDQNYPDGEVDAGKRYGNGAPYFMNGPKIHEYLKEMHEQVLSGYDVMTVGEMPGVTPEQGALYTGEDRDELNMVFNFDHVDLDSGLGGKWDVKPWSLVELKDIFTRWQHQLEESGWNSLYWNNHDQPRIVSRFGNDSEEYRVVSAKMLAATLHLLKGTPYIYQGEELGMTNVKFPSIEDYRDIETLNMYKEKVEQGADPDELMEAIYVKSRDNARTPMQWNGSDNAGFTNGDPWLAVNPNYSSIHAKQALEDTDSVFYFYQKLIELRKNHDIIVYGDYQLLLGDHPKIYAYLRTLGDEKLLVVSNFAEENIDVELPQEVEYETVNLLINNYYVHPEEDINSITLQPYETRAYLLK
ncbi:glycoside hydrolase family 13 protein [Thalassobacillus pellis]|uniref:glycoside hydrolase family 13 protein n=1 Tax=Thalassobacillus pellis TaxID=748008 RepID=UPI00195F5451|nr:alpha-glucosidase [Thalassobacillus pellis]MBM7551489.1 oligo-1,6-glucosidase [Thalassobacillus pellis]